MQKPFLYKPIGGIFLLFFFGIRVSSQVSQTVFSHFTKSSELNSASVSDILQDDLGYIWFGTREGLYRYDGQKVETIHQKFANNGFEVPYDISCLLKDKKGKIWMGSAEGVLGYYNPKTLDFQSFKIPVNDTVSLTTIWDIAEDKNGNLWLALERGIAFFDTQTRSFRTWRPTLNSPELVHRRYNVVYAIHPDSEQASLIWLSTRQGLLHFSIEKEAFSKVKLPKEVLPFQGAIKEIYENSGVFWFGASANSVIRYESDKNRWKVFTPETPFTNSLRCLLPKSKREFWVGGVEIGLGILNVETERFSFFPTVGIHANLPGTIESVFKDSNGILWVGTEKGVSLINPSMQSFKHYDLALNYSVLPSFFHSNTFVQPNQDSMLYVGTQYGSHLIAINRKSGKVTRISEFPIEIPAGQLRFYDALEDKAGNIWFASLHGMFVLLKGDNKLTFPEWDRKGVLGSCRFKAMTLDPSGNIWALISPQGFMKIDLSAQTTRFYALGEEAPPHHPRPDALNDISSDSKGNIWFTAEPFLVKFNPESETFQTWTASENCGDCLSDSWTFALAIDHQDVVWVSYKYNGLDRFDPSAPIGKQFRHFGVESGLPSNKVFKIETDEDNNLWLATGNGLSQLDTKSFTFTNYSTSDGLRENNLHRRWATSLQRISTGEIILGGIGYFTTFSPHELKPKVKPPNLIFTGLQVFDQTKQFEKHLHLMDEISLSWRENFFTFNFSTLDFSHVKEVSFQYKLEGFDKEWRTTNEGTAQYTNVGGGEYVFRVKMPGRAALAQEISIKVQILPPFWRTTWFYLLGGFIIATAIYGFYQYRIGQIKEKEALKTAFNKKLMEVEMSALRSQMNPHFLFNSLNSIKNYIAKSEPRAATRYLTKFSQLMRLILNNSKMQTVTLANELKALELYIELESLRFSKKFNFEINIDEAVQTEKIRIPPLILQPYVENAIWHGLMHKTEKGKLKIDVYKNGTVLFCDIEDNGIGRKKAMEIKSKSAVRQKSMGLQITSERLKMVNQLQGIEMKVSIIDLIDEAGLALGTKVHIQMPI